LQETFVFSFSFLFWKHRDRDFEHFCEIASVLRELLVDGCVAEVVRDSDCLKRGRRFEGGSNTCL